VLRQLHAIFRKERILQAAVRGVIGLLAVALLDGAWAWPETMQMLYLVPTYLAATRGGLWSGIPIAAGSAAVSTAMSLRAQSSVTVFELHFGITLTILCLCAFIVVRMEERWQRAMDLASKDSLTHAANRYALEAFGRAELDLAVSRRHDLTVALVDIDSFKELNDRFGHTFGDQVLRTFVRVARRAVGDAGLIGRYGGDEFVIVLPKWRPDEAHWLLDRISERFSTSTTLLGATSNVSIGLAELYRDGTSLEALITAADRRMYRQKLGSTAAIPVVSQAA
jgi:diguanylate cyclase (GGDEF)-like protein